MDLLPLVTIVMAFGAVFALVYVVGQYVATEVRVQQRATIPQREPEGEGLFAGVNSLVSTYFDEKRFGLEDSFTAVRRRELVRAGYFHPQSVRYYVFVRLVTMMVPAVAFLVAFTMMENSSWLTKGGLVAVAFFLAIVGPDGWIARRQRNLTQRYRELFPDLLDLMVVCTDAGLSLEAALERISLEIMKQSRQLGMNLVILGAEMRAGRTIGEALSSLADRLGLDEARSFAAMLRQSIELGTDVGTALRVFSDEMRDRRLMRAEEKANQLPVKMVLPLGIIFVVILLLILFPVGVSLMKAFSHVG
jgi:tight adherence protein C